MRSCRSMPSICPQPTKQSAAPVTLDPKLESALLRWGSVLLALVVALFLGDVYRSAGGDGLAQLAKYAGASILLAGKLVIFAGLKEGEPPIWTLTLMTFLIDLAFAFALASGLRGLERAPVVGPWLLRARTRAKQVLVEYPGLRRLAFFGVVAFVLLPIAGTGSITGSIVARLLGLPRLTGIGAVATASGVSALGFALLAIFFGEQGRTLLENPLIVAGVVGLVGALSWRLYQRFVRELRRKT